MRVGEDASPNLLEKVERIISSTTTQKRLLAIKKG